MHAMQFRSSTRLLRSNESLRSAYIIKRSDAIDVVQSKSPSNRDTRNRFSFSEENLAALRALRLSLSAFEEVVGELFRGERDEAKG